MKTVLVSVTDKTGLETFLRRLEHFDSLKIIATTSTARFLEEHGFSCTRVEELTGFPEILSGRVKTLHPRVFAGILARPSQQDRSCLAQLEISEIDIVVVNLYAFEEKLAEGLTEEEMIEQIDVGGVALLRAAAKNFERVATVSDPRQYDYVIENLDSNDKQLPLSFRRQLAYEAFLRTARYDESISTYLGGCIKAWSGDSHNVLPESLTLSLRKYQNLRYGENPHQIASWYTLVPSETLFAGVFGDITFPPFIQLQGKELSSNNITDTYTLVKILRDIGSPGACIIKHNNPCGVALGKSIQDAFEKAYTTDSLSAFGGVYGFTEPVDASLASRIAENFVEIVLAPDFDESALQILAKKKNLRVLRHHVHKLSSQTHELWHLRDLQDFGWILEQEAEAPVVPTQFKCVTEHAVDPSLAGDVAFSWSVVTHLTSNAIFVVKEYCSLGFGIGQTSRIASVELALKQAGQHAKGAVLASDGFFPQTDNIEAAAKAGISVIVQPGGSLKDAEVISAANRAGIAMLFTGQRCFKH